MRFIGNGSDALDITGNSVGSPVSPFLCFKSETLLNFEGVPFFILFIIGSVYINFILSQL